MTHDEIHALMEHRGRPKMKLPLSGDDLLHLSFELDDEHRENAIEAVRRLSQIPRESRAAIQGDVFAAYQTSIAENSLDFASAQAQLDWEAGRKNSFFSDPVVPKSASDIWKLVVFRSVIFRHGRDSGALYLGLEGECAWDGAHGVTLYFREGDQFVKVDDINATVE